MSTTSAANAEYANYGMLRTIAEAKSLFYHAHCHYRQAASAQNVYYRVKEARNGTATLQRAFSLIQQDSYLNQQYPVLMAQAGYIPKLDTVIVLANNDRNNNEQKESSLYRKIMQFIRRCEEITIHQQSLLAAVAVQIRAESPSLVAREGVGVRKGYVRNNILRRPRPPAVSIGAVESESEFEPIPFSHSASSSSSTNNNNNDGEERNYNNILPNEFEPLPFANPSVSDLREEGHSTVDQVLPPIIPDEVYLGEMRSGGGGGGNRRGKEIDSSLFLPDVTAVTMNTTLMTAAEAPGARRVSTATDDRRLAPPQKQQQQKQKCKQKPQKQKQKRKLNNNDSGCNNNDHQDHDEFTLALGGRDDFVRRDFSF